MHERDGRLVEDEREAEGLKRSAHEARVESELGKGSDFFVVIPREQEEFTELVRLYSELAKIADRH